jgi:single-stranded-DNA-specific exonuclease
VVGILAGRLTEKYNRPSLVMTYNKEKDLVVGSLRGPEYFNIVDMLKQAHMYLENYGGHQQA